ncbi:lysoplasmalogenase [Ectobacillus polymachus]|uniref:lysoplasmalogenase n=1 Tax=Ectobacillus polymachus TaxID=1508806 RepID=UPI003A849CC0
MQITILFIPFQVLLFLIGFGLAIWKTKEGGNWILPLPIRLVLSFSLTGAALWLWFQNLSSSYKQWIAIGMTLSTIGDLFMAGMLPFGNRLIGGMIAFAIAHCFYVTAFLHAGFSWTGAIIGFVVYGSCLLFGWLFFIRNETQPPLFTIGALVYGLWVGGMACFACALSFARQGVWWLPAIGGALFVVSDFIIGVTDIGQRKIKHAELWIWLTYVTAQMAIVYSG